MESSVPAVRCATVAACTADLAADSLCLVDLVFEVQKRGVLGGVGMLIWDAFNHHLKEELQQRRSNEGGDTDQGEDEELDGKYTGAVINSARNIGKISQNIGGLMNSKKDQEKEGAVKSDDNCEEGRSAEEDSSEIPVRRACYGKNDDDVPEVSTEETDSDSSPQAQGDYVKENEATTLESEDGSSTKLETKQTSQEAESEVKMEQKKEGENLMPVLIGGGLAVLGALVGGITVAAANNKNDEKRRSRESDGS